MFSGREYITRISVRSVLVAGLGFVRHLVQRWNETEAWSQIMRLKDEAGFYKHGMLLGACMAIWSFFSTLGVALLIAAWFALNSRYIRAAVLPFPALLQQVGGALLMLILFLYISSNNLSMGHGFFSEMLTEAGQRSRYIVLLAFEFALVGIGALWLLPHGRRGLLVALMVVLAALPLYTVGNYGNELAMRASIPFLFVFWCVVLDGFHDSRDSRFIAETLKVLILAAVLAGAVTPGMEIYRSLALKENFERFTVTTPGTQTYKSLADYKISIPRFEDVRDVDKVTHPEQYIGHRRSFFFRVLARNPIRERAQ